MALFLREADVGRLLTMDIALQAVEEAFRCLGLAMGVDIPRQQVRTGSPVLSMMMAGTRDYLGFKSYCTSPQGTGTWVHLFDAKTGDYLAVMEASKLGQMRTGAASGIATRYLARADANICGIFGTGWQARSQVLAICSVRPINQIKVIGRDPERLTHFCAEVRQTTGVDVVPSSSPEEVIRGSQVVISVTKAATPLFDGRWLEAGTHVNAVGSHRLNAREIDGETVARADIVAVDSVEQARRESGDLTMAEREGKFHWEKAVELGDIVVGRVSGRDNPEQITLFKSHGIAIWDVATAGAIYKKAVAEGVGIIVPLEGNTMRSIQLESAKSDRD